MEDRAARAVEDSGAPKLRVEGLTVDYGATVALAGLDLTVGEGEFVSLLGPSGCGKTTLLRVIAGLQRPKRGRVLLDGRDVTNLAPEKRPLNMVFQHLALFPHLSVGGNIGFGLSLQKVSRAETRRRVAAMLELVGLGGFETRSTHQLSGGQQQRVALARALITEPSILLLDEPLGALDLSIRKEMQSELKSLQRRLNITFVFVTHDQTEAMAMSDRVVLMRSGAILQDATPFESYTNPANAFAAGFVGDTNLFEGRVVSSDRAEATVSFPTGVELRVRGRMRVGASVVVSVRPEQVTIASPTTPEGVRGFIVAESFFGAEVVVEVDSDLGTLNVRVPARRESLGRVGCEVKLLIDPDSVRVFELE